MQRCEISSGIRFEGRSGILRMYFSPAQPKEFSMSTSAPSAKRASSSAPSPTAPPENDGLGAESVEPGRAERALSGFNGNRRVPPPVNEPIKSYAPGAPERAELKSRLKTMSGERIDI